MRTFLLLTIAAIIVALTLVSGSTAFVSPLPSCDWAAHNTCMRDCPDDYVTCANRCPWPQECPVPTLGPTPTPGPEVGAQELGRVFLPVVGR